MNPANPVNPVNPGTDNAPVVVLTGMSGAGKQAASRCFEDMKWRVVDNLPPRLLPSLLSDAGEAAGVSLCLVCDVRGGRVGDLLPVLDKLSPAPTLLFLDASDEALIQRFKETRRTPPVV